MFAWNGWALAPAVATAIGISDEHCEDVDEVAEDVDSSSDEEGHEPPKVATNKDASQAQEGTKQQHDDDDADISLPEVEQQEHGYCVCCSDSP